MKTTSSYHFNRGTGEFMQVHVFTLSDHEFCVKESVALHSKFVPDLELLDENIRRSILLNDLTNVISVCFQMLYLGLYLLLLNLQPY